MICISIMDESSASEADFNDYANNSDTRVEDDVLINDQATGQGGSRIDHLAFSAKISGQIVCADFVTAMFSLSK